MKRGNPRHAAAFFERAVNQKTDECIIWPFALAGKGYPIISRRGVQVGAHREMCVIVNGEPPSPDHETAHSCGNRACINGRHLTWKTHSDNELDKRRHGTDLGGENHPSHKLTALQVIEIRAIGDSMPQAKLAQRFGISQTHVGSILRREKWANL